MSVELKRKINNKKFAETDEIFIRICKEIGIEPTKRQASKFRMKKGIVWKMRKDKKDGFGR